MKQIEFERWEPDAENPRKLKYAGQRKAEDVFHELEARLDSVGYLPDEYLLLDNRWQNGREMPRDAGFFCRTDYGGSEGIYLDMFLEWYEDSQRRTEHFMTGKTLGESGADMDRMSLISSAITKAFRGDSGVHARYMVVGGQPGPEETMSLHLSPDEQRDYLRRHYWDRFDFTDTLFVSEADTVQMIEAFARYIAVLSDRPADSAPMDSLMRRASSSKPMLDYFAMLAGTVLHDPNSPLRNDEFYIPVLRAQLASPFYDEYERIAPQYDLEMAMQNRLGQPANDFRYTLASGASGTLYGLQAEYVLLFINNPGCAMCREIREAITSSPMLSEMIERGRLKVLALYPDEDLTEWRDYRDHIPASWINAYDKGCVVREKSLYDLHAIPALYLLDSRKRVLVKDSTDVAQIEEIIDRRA